MLVYHNTIISSIYDIRFFIHPSIAKNSIHIVCILLVSCHAIICQQSMVMYSLSNKVGLERYQHQEQNRATGMMAVTLINNVMIADFNVMCVCVHATHVSVTTCHVASRGLHPPFVGSLLW